MTKLKRTGIITIIVGVFIPSVLYPFTSLTRSATLKQITFANKGGVYESRVNDLEIVFKKGTWTEYTYYKDHYKGRIAVPYQYILAIGITIVFLGIGLIALADKESKASYG